MLKEESRDQTPQPKDATESETTGLPGLHSWRSVYVVVIIVFMLWVVLLTALSRVFS